MRRRRGEGLSFRKQKKTLNGAAIREVVTWAVEILIAVFIALTLVYCVCMRTSVVGQAMSGTIEAGDEILINRFIYKVTSPKAGDIVVFLPNGNEKSHYYVRRVIAVPGDTVQIAGGIVYVNGEPYDEKADANPIEDAGLAEEEITLQANEYFVLGDNRNNSEDSRYANIGNIKKEYIVGKAWFLISPSIRRGFL